MWLYMQLCKTERQADIAYVVGGRFLTMFTDNAVPILNYSGQTKISG